VITPGNYFETLQQKRRHWSVSFKTEVILLNAILLFAPAWFWTSVMFKVGLGTDYFFDVFFDSLSQNFLGNLLLVFFVIGIPGFLVGINGLMYLRKRETIAWWAMVVGALFLALGFFALVRRA
jgi:hypothetical protein